MNKLRVIQCVEVFLPLIIFFYSFKNHRFIRLFLNYIFIYKFFFDSNSSKIFSIGIFWHEIIQTLFSRNSSLYDLKSVRII